MSSNASFFEAEQRNIKQSLTLIEQLVTKDCFSRYETIALGTLLQNIHTGVERVLRYRLKNLNIELAKGESWHKDILVKSRELGLLSESQFQTFLDLLLFRHLHIHGYGFMLNEKRLRQLAEPVSGLVREFFERISERQD